MTLTVDDILMLAGDNLVPWIVCWRALGKPSKDRDEALAECERVYREKYGDGRCAGATE